MSSVNVVVESNQVIEYENEMNENLYNNLKLSSKVSNLCRIKKALKPLLRLLRNKRRSLGGKKRSKPCHVQEEIKPQEESFTEDFDNQNNSNELLESRLKADLENAQKGSAVTVCLDGKMTIIPVVPGQCYVPVHFVHTHAGDFYWTTTEVNDNNNLCYKETAFTQHHVPEMQVAAA